MVQWKSMEQAGKDTDVGYDVWPVHNWGFAHSLRHWLRKENQVGWESDIDQTNNIHEHVGEVDYRGVLD